MPYYYLPRQRPITQQQQQYARQLELQQQQLHAQQQYYQAVQEWIRQDLAYRNALYNAVQSHNKSEIEKLVEQVVGFAGAGIVGNLAYAVLMGLFEA